MGYYVSRQNYWDEQRLVVEISVGGSKAATKDILPAKYDPFECKNLKYPNDALNVAKRIYKKWKFTADSDIYLSIVDKDNKTILSFEKDWKSAENWAQKIMKTLERCKNCDKAIVNLNKSFTTSHLPGHYCNEECANTKYKSAFNAKIPKK